ncbi:LLM class flavin-dependent oxidoreductase [Amycolatopsis sp. NPDC005232]|uniref:LLM class flavin-dependent oxidoreductase n=1 Tax=Amycolatopsis sp. NPDC005232 TaxID=3157027 RepID=UPI0033BC1230
MADFGRPVSFGISIDPTAAGFAPSLDIAQRADRAGLDYLAVQDHPYQPGYLDMWTMVTYLLARTERISVLPDVADLQLRPPTILAKAAASLAAMAGGRVQLGVGGGASAPAIASMGGIPRSGSSMVTFTDEAIQILRQALKGDAIEARTDQHQVTGYQAGPIPPKPIEVWVGAQKPKMLAVTGRSSDGWVCPLNIYIAPDEVPGLQSLIDKAAADAGREPREVRRIYNVLGSVGGHRGGQGLLGPVEQWVDTLADWTVRLGFDTFVFWPITDPAGQLEIFTTQVVPAVRARVAELRDRA